MNTKKLLCLFVALLLGVASIARAASADDATAAVLAADRARGAALLAADTKALEKILADDFNYTHSNNHLETKKSHLATLTDGLRYKRFETSSLRAHVITPDVVTVNGIIDQTKGKEDKWTDNHLLFLAVWRKTAANTWELTALQTAAPPAAGK